MGRPSIVENHKKFEDILKLFLQLEKKGRTIRHMYNQVQRIEGCEDIKYEHFYQWQKRFKDNLKKGEAKKTHVPHQSRNEYVKWKQPVIREGREDPIHFAEVVLGMQLHGGQKRWLTESIANPSKKTILVPSNQWGKTLALAVKHIWYCFYKVGYENLPPQIKKQLTYETIALSPKLRQVRALYGYILQILMGNLWWKDENGGIQMNDGCKIKEFLFEPRKVPSTQQLSTTPIRFNNGSQIQVSSTGQDMGGSLAGGQFPYMSYDECGLSNNLKEELPTRLMSRLIKYNGALDLVGTPDDLSQSYLYYKNLVKQGIEGEDGWKTLAGKLDDNVMIDEKTKNEIKERLRTTDPLRYKQVVFGEFIEGASLVFKPQVIKNIWNEKGELVEEQTGAWLAKEPEIGHSYVIGVDWAIANDYTVMIVLDYTNEAWEIVYFYRIKGSDKPPEQQYIDFLELKRRYNNADAMLDTCGLGGKLIENEFKDEPGVNGFNFGPGKKAGFISALQKYLYYNNGEGRIKAPYIPELEEELGIYQINDKNIRQDIVMALGLAVWFLDSVDEMPDAVDYFV